MAWSVWVYICATVEGMVLKKSGRRYRTKTFGLENGIILVVRSRTLRLLLDNIFNQLKTTKCPE